MSPKTALAREASYVRAAGMATRPTLSQIWSFEIYRETFLNYTKSADLLMERL